MFTDLQKLFLDQHGSFAKNLQFETIVIFAIVMIVLTQAFERNYGFVIILIVFALYVSNTYVTVKNDKINDFNSITMFKLQTLQSKMYYHINKKLQLIQTTGTQSVKKSDVDKMYKASELDSLYIDANLIHFLYSIIKLYEYNDDVYASLLRGTNNILKMKRQIDEYYNSNGSYPENTSEMFEIALSLRANTINNLHDFIYTVPKTSKMYNYINDSVERYATLISRITDDIHKSYRHNIQLTGINATTKFVNYNTTKHFDPYINHPSTPHKQDEMIIPFYV
jgi:hypothetical protein